AEEYAHSCRGSPDKFRYRTTRLLDLRSLDHGFVKTEVDSRSTQGRRGISARSDSLPWKKRWWKSLRSLPESDRLHRRHEDGGLDAGWPVRGHRETGAR